MVSINGATREIVCKIVYYGPGMSGKTTNLQQIHRGLPQGNRGDLVSLDTQQERTLFFDFLPIDLGTIKGYKTKFQLYTVPGQVYYNATRKLVLRGVDGIVFVADSQPAKMGENLESWANLRENLAGYGYSLTSIPHVIQFNKQDLPGVLSPADMSAAINPDGTIPTLSAVANEGKGVKDTLKLVASAVLDQLRAKIDNLATVQAEREAKEAEAAASSPALAQASAGAARGSATATAPPPPRLRARPDGGNGSVNGVQSRKLIDPNKIAEKRPMLRRRVQPEVLPQWDIEQPCDVHWRGLCVGRGRVFIHTRENVDKEGAYLLSANMRICGLVRRSFSTPASPTVRPQPGEGARLIAPGDDGRVETEMIVEPGDTPRLWLRVRGLTLTPRGQRPRGWPADPNLTPPEGKATPVKEEPSDESAGS